MATNIYDATGRQIARVGSAARAGFAAATGGLDQYGPEIAAHPFAANEIPDRTSGIARIVSKMIGARRDIANAKEARERKAVRDEYDRLRLDHMRQVVTGTVPKAPGADKSRQPISSDLAGLYDLTSFIPDPNDPNKGTADSKEIATAASEFRSGRSNARMVDRAKEVDKRMLDLAARRVAARSKVAEQEAALRDLDTRAKIEGETAANIVRSRIAKELPWLTMTRGLSAGGKEMDQAAFWARRKQAAEYLGASWKTKDGEPVYLDTENTLHAFDVPNQERLNLLIEKERQAAINKFQSSNQDRRMAITMMRDKYLHLDAVLASMRPGGQTGEGNIEDWNANPDNTPALAPEQPQYQDPMEQLKEWDKEDEEQ